MFIYTGGKTAGHVYPLISLIKEIDIKTIFVGYKDSLEEKICLKENIEFIGITPKKNKIITALNGLNELKKRFENEKVSCVISTGGYVSISVLLYSFFKNIPLYLLEENVVMGRVNKMFSIYAKKVFLVYKLDKMKRNYLVTGLPIRKIDNYDIPVIYDCLIIGGSLGSKPLCDIAKLISKKYKVCLIAGKYYKDYISYDNLKVIEYADNIYYYMKSSKVILCRAGSSTTYEIISMGIPLIVCPSENTKDDHQNLNALYLLKNNVCKLVRENNLNKDIINVLTLLINNEKVRKDMINNQNKFCIKSASNKIKETILSELK